LQGLKGDSQERLLTVCENFVKSLVARLPPFPKCRAPLSVSTSSSTTPLPNAQRRTVTLSVFSLLVHFTLSQTLSTAPHCLALPPFHHSTPSLNAWSPPTSALTQRFVHCIPLRHLRRIMCTAGESPRLH
jgi:hypothetical protein